MAASSTITLLKPIAAGRDRWTPWVVAALALAFFVTVCRPILPYARQHDFLSFYTGASLVKEGKLDLLYDLPTQTRRQQSLVPGLIYIAPYIRPPFYAALLSPIAALPLTSAFTVWLCIQIAALFLVWWWAWRRFCPDSLVFCSLFLPAAYGIANGQDCVLILAVMLGAWIALERGRDGVAGALAALTIVKFHLLLLLLPALLLRKKWRMAAGYAAVAGVEAAVSIAMVGASGVRQYTALLTAKDLETLSPSPERMLNVQALLVNAGANTPAMRAIAIAAVVLATGIAVWRAREEWVWFWIAALGSILIAPHAYQYDAAMLLPPILFCIFATASRPLRIAAATAALPVPYLCTLVGPPWAAAPSLVLTIWFVVISWNSGQAWPFTRSP
jgi:hypothetical protein